MGALGGAYNPRKCGAFQTTECPGEQKEQLRKKKAHGRSPVAGLSSSHTPGCPVGFCVSIWCPQQTNLLTFPAEMESFLSWIPWQSRAPGMADQSIRFGT